MRTFVLYANKARTDDNFNIEDLPSSGGRLDLVARCISSALWLSHGLRDAEIYCVLNGPPRPPITIKWEASKIRRVNPDERSIALWLKKILSEQAGKEWKAARPGMLLAVKSFQEIVTELKDRPIYVLHEGGEALEKVKIEKDPVFVLGDHMGIPEEELSALRTGKKVSLGKKSYLTSNCIATINWFCDKSA